MQIVDADINEMYRFSGRQRTPENSALLDAVLSLKPGMAQAVVLAEGDTEKSVKSRLMYVARMAGRKLQTASDGKKVMFALAQTQPRRRRFSS